MNVLVVDAANVVGSRPDGWWKDRARAARRLHEQLMVADTAYDEIVMVLEGAAKGGVKAGRDAHVRTVHAKGAGDDTIVAEARAALGKGHRVTVITADQLLRALVGGAGATAMSPSWLLDQL
ncbi:NYN domain-containing protein [Nocardioides sp. AE5]|uniref:NYN domain-containing protein n=1 Tax=Nocardioides sp. AE5 TaxID=2962573 RepID=UPI0028819623|nr:NYN domain-containing protein [Nocardioides sp. AE5]MDT0203252.1 NYN domain-containing protein [Nocardioides sp. AE5]